MSTAKFLDRKVKLGDSLRKELDALLTHGWISIHAYMSQLEPSEASMDVLFYLLRAETRSRKRLFIMHRLYRCFADMRRRLEEHVIYA